MVRSLIIVLGTLFVWGCGGGGGGSGGGLEPGDLTGEWAGTTSGGGLMTLTVTEAGVDRIVISYSGPGCNGETTYEPETPYPIEDGTFRVEYPDPRYTVIEGTFEDETTATGTLELGTGCGVIQRTWSLARTP